MDENGFHGMLSFVLSVKTNAAHKTDVACGKGRTMTGPIRKVSHLQPISAIEGKVLRHLPAFYLRLFEKSRDKLGSIVNHRNNTGIVQTGRADNAESTKNMLV